MTKTITLGPGLKVNALDFVERATGVVAKRGKGKTGGVKVVEEGLLNLALPFVVLDPVGLHWGLKSSFDGKKPSGYKVLVIGGEHGDLPLDRKAGRIVARSIAASNLSLIIDFKGTPHAAYREFVADFADELLHINKVPRLIIIEEAHVLLPQKVRPDQTACLDAVTRIVTMGRNSALGCLIVSQRPATVNKDTLTQVDNLVVMGITSPNDRKVVQEWVEQNAELDDLKTFLAGLAKLQPREAWFWSPDADIFQQFRFQDFTTFHPDRTHLRKLGLLSVTPVQTDVDSLIGELDVEMKALAERAKAEDPKVLQAEVKRLRAELTKAQATPSVQVEQSIVEKPVPFVPQEWLHNVKTASEAIQKASASIATILAESPKLGQVVKSTAKSLASVTRQPHPAHVEAKKHLALISPIGPESGTLTPSDRRILTVLAQRPAGVPIDRLAILSGYSVNGRFTNLLGGLRNKGYISPARVSPITITEEGSKALGGFDELPTGTELQKWWLERLSPSEQKIMQVLFNLGPGNFIDITSLAESSGYSVNGRFTNLLGRLRTRGLVSPARQPIKAADDFFEG